MIKIRNSFKHFVGKYPLFFSAFYRLQGKNLKLLVCDSTELVIEGFPRSANTWAVVFFEYFQKRGVDIAHHLHVESQLIYAARKDIPAIVLIREPEGCIKSLLVREKHYTIERALHRYIEFYENLMPFRAKMIIANFEEVVGRMPYIIEKCNLKFGTRFNAGEMNETTTARIYSEIEAVNHRLDNGKETHVARPSPKRESSYNNFTFEGHEKLLGRATQTYKKFIGLEAINT